jgi:type I restriction enzyme S subunit
MQELLTGKRRLPGFDGEWTVRKMGDFSTIVSGGTPSTFHPEYWGGHIAWMNSGELNLKRVYAVEGRITEAGLCNSSTTEVPKHSVLIGLAGQGKTRGTVAMNYVNLCTNQSIAAVFPNETEYCSEYLYQNLDNRYDELRELSTGDGGRGGLNLTILRNLDILFPPLTEQTAIAEILSDMDAEITALEKKLSKARLIKQGMMQELLTGRIRLTEQETETVATPKIVELPKREPKVTTAQTGGHNQPFDDAVMIAGIVNVLYSDKFPLGRKKVQKCLYLLRRHQDESTAAFKKHAAGPYADEIRYKGGEPIALSAKYIKTTTTKGKGTTFARGGSIDKALGYIRNWGRQSDIKWVADKLKFKKVDELELLATVDMAICDLTEAEIPISVDSIKHLIATNEEWKAKLKKQIFSETNITRAIKELQALL